MSYTEQRTGAVMLNVTLPTAGGHATLASLYADEGAAGISVMCADTIVADLCGILEEERDVLGASGLISFHRHEWINDWQTVGVIGTLDPSGLRIRADGSTPSPTVVVLLESGVRRAWPEEFTAGTTRPDVGQQVDGKRRRRVAGSGDG